LFFRFQVRHQGLGEVIGTLVHQSVFYNPQSTHCHFVSKLDKISTSRCT
jgi:hypothetical protein